MRCPDCNKFVSLEMSDPEVDSDLEIDTTGDDPSFHIFGSVRIVRTCADCSAELKEATLDVDLAVEWGEVFEGDETPKGDVLEALKSRANDAELEESGIEPVEEGGGRYAKSYFGAEVVFRVNIGDVTVASAIFSNKVAASAMDELV